MRSDTRVGRMIEPILFRFSWGARIRTWECGDQNPVPYRLATPQLGVLLSYYLSVMSNIFHEN